MTTESTPKNPKQTKSAAAGLFPFIIVAFVALLVASGWALFYQMPNQQSQNLGTEAAARQENPERADRIYKRVHEITGDVTPIETLGDKTIAVRAAIQNGNFPEAEAIIANIMKQSRMDGWRFAPFEKFMWDIFEHTAADTLDKLDLWVQQSADKPLPHMMRAMFYYRTGWKKRGHGFNSTVSESAGNSFRDYLKKAYIDIETARRLDDSSLYRGALRIFISRSTGWSLMLEKAFDEETALHPDYYVLYDQYINGLAPKWGGSLEAMISFVEKHGGSAPNNSPKKMLYLELYHQIVNTAWVYCGDHEKNSVGTPMLEKMCMEKMVSKYLTPDLAGKAFNALNLYNTHDKYVFSRILSSIIKDIAGHKQADDHVDILIKSAAKIMGSGNRLGKNEPSPNNNYLLDVAAAKMWEKKDDFGKAEMKYKEALDNISNMAFPDATTKQIERGVVLSNLAELYYDNKQYEDAIVYHQAAKKLAGADLGPMTVTCLAFEKLKAYRSTIAACGEELQLGEHDYMRYKKAWAAQKLDWQDAALADYKILIENGGRYDLRSTAILYSAFYKAVRYDVQGVLDILNEYPEIYDERKQSSANLYRFYEYRCGAHYMLNHLEQAEADCKKAAQFGYMPKLDILQGKIAELLKAKAAGRP
ncbi:MAG: hypothetical protein OXT65_12165 [Alphaproteobacteria bacterium]|nr:hypothetical protein [Alphaproteobacteria bacterium]